MPNYDTSNFNRIAKRLFRFLISEFGFKLVRDECVLVTYIVTYEKERERVELKYDFKDNAFYFYIYTKGTNPKREFFYNVFSKYEKVDFKKIIPDDKQFQKSLELNALLLKKHGKKIFKPILT